MILLIFEINAMIESFKFRAIENLYSSESLFDLGYYNACANRAYYSIFHCALVTLIEKGFTPNLDHRNVLSMFNNELINRRKIFSSKLKDIFHESQELRNDADYRNGVSKAKAKKTVDYANVFLTTVFKDFKHEN